VEAGTGFYEQAQMLSARPGAPVPVIRVHEKWRDQADSVVAAQCAMLVVLWSDPSRVFGMAFEDDACSALAAATSQPGRVICSGSSPLCPRPPITMWLN
jgi:hypothetical protein